MEFGNIHRSHVLLVLLLLGQRFCTEINTPKELIQTIREMKEDLGEAIEDLVGLPSLRLHGRAPGDLQEARRNQALLNKLNMSLALLDSVITSFGLDSFGGGMYIRWGRRDCPNEAERMYYGHAGGGHSIESGAAAEYVCIPQIPDYLSRDLPHVNAMLWGAKYMTFDWVFPQVHTMKVPCALCRTVHRRTAFMVPGWRECNDRSVKSTPWYFYTEYTGYLMSGQVDHQASSSYVCLDSQPQFINLSRAEFYPKLFYFTVTRCGALECPPYEEGRPIPCAVCSI